MIGQIIFIIGASIAGGLLAWWVHARFRGSGKAKERRRGRRY